MGLLLCRCWTEMTVTDSFEMRDVPASIAAETFCDFEAAPSFIPFILSVEFIRGGHPSESKITEGACWLERRRYGQGDIVIRKTITKISENTKSKLSGNRPCFEVGISMDVVDTYWRVPAFVGTFTVVIAPSEKNDDDDASNVRHGSSVYWSDAFVSTGVRGRIMMALCLSCLKRGFLAHAQEEWRYYYEEARRRTTTGVVASGTKQESGSTRSIGAQGKAIVD